MGGGDNKASDQIAQNRQQINQTGNTLNQNAQNSADAYQALAAQRAAQAYQAYQPALEGGGGYTPQQTADIEDKGGLAALPTSDAALQSNYLTDGEQSSIMGDQSGINGALTQVNGAVDPASVATFTQATRLTPEQQQAMATSAARDASTQSQAQIDANRQAAIGAGMNPLGVAGYTSQADRQAQIASANASAAARVQAAEIAAQREQGILGANQTLAAQRAQAAQTGLGAQQTMENNASQRAAGIAANRQGVGQSNQGTRFNQGQYVEGQTSGRAAGVADTQRQDQQNARQFLTGEENLDTGAGLAEQGIQNGVFGTQTSGNNTATGQQIQADNKPAWWQSLLSAGSQVAAGSKYV